MDAAIPIALAVVAFALAPVVYATLRLRRTDGRIRLFEVLQGKKLPLPDSQSEASVRAAAYAVRRCVNCSAQPACDEAIARNDWKALAQVCPNQEYVEGLRRC